MNKEEETNTGFAGDLLDLGPESRRLMLVPVYDQESRNNGLNLIRGFALHQHSDVPIVTSDGVGIDNRCDFIVLDIRQMKQLAHMFLSMDLTILDKEGNPIDE